MTRKQAMEMLEGVHNDLQRAGEPGEPPPDWSENLVAVLLVIAHTLIEMQDIP